MIFVKIVLEDCAGVDVPDELIRLMAGSVACRVEDPERVEIVIGGDFVGSVQDRARDPAEAANYDTDRMFGVVAAKTITSEDGISSIILAVDQVLAFNHGILARTMEHEALHAVIDQRGESLFRLGEHLDAEATAPSLEFAPIIGVAVDEYRIERALDDDGMVISPPQSASVPDTLVRLREQIIDGITPRPTDTTILRCSQTVMTAFHRATLLFAYAAAEDLATAGEIRPARNAKYWRRLVGDHYESYRNALARLPPATQATAFDQLRDIAVEIEPVLGAWLRHIGFQLEDLNPGLFFRILRHDF